MKTSTSTILLGGIGICIALPALRSWLTSDAGSNDVVRDVDERRDQDDASGPLQLPLEGVGIRTEAQGMSSNDAVSTSSAAGSSPVAAPTDTSTDAPLPGFASKYEGMTSQQLLDEGKTMDAAYTQLTYEAGRVLRRDQSLWIDVTEGIDDTDWEGVAYISIGRNGRTYRVRLEREDYPEVYALRDEAEWLYTRSREELANEAMSR